MSSLRALLAMCAVLVTVLASTSASAWTPPASKSAPRQTSTEAKTRVGNFCTRGVFALRAPALLRIGTHQENRVARAKSTSEACFITQDPIGVAGGANLYAFVGNSPLDFWDPYGLDGVPYNLSAEERRASLGVVLNPTNQCAATASCEQWPWYQRALIGLMQGFQPAGDAGEGGERSLNPFYASGTTAFTSVNPFKLAPPGSGKFIMGGLGFGDDAVRAAVNAGSKAGGGLDEAAAVAGRGLDETGGAVVARMAPSVAGGMARTLDSSAIRFTQDSIGRTFRNGGSLKDAIAGLRSGAIDPSSFPAIRIFTDAAGNLATLDNRRLFVFQQAGIAIRTVAATAREIADETFKFTTKNAGASIRVRGGL